MIGFLKGSVLTKQAPNLLLDVHGVGYEVETSMTTFYTLPEVGESVSLYIHFLVRDDAQRLFGFASERERSLFRQLIKVSGVGAKMALVILSGMEAEQFRHCIQDGDVAHLTRLPGVGKKTAERLIVEMRDRLQTESTNMIATQKVNNPIVEAVSALLSLGYKQRDAETYVRQVAAEQEDMSSEEIIRAALKASVR